MEGKLEVSGAKKSQVKILVSFLVLLAFSLTCFADTFTHRQTGEVLHGYIAGQAGGGEAIASTKEKGQVGLDLAQWQIATDRLGRNNEVIVLTIEDEIGLEIETQALEREVAKLSNEGPLFILFEIDTPGGRGCWQGRWLTGTPKLLRWRMPTSDFLSTPSTKSLSRVLCTPGAKKLAPDVDRCRGGRMYDCRQSYQLAPGASWRIGCGRRPR